MKAYAITVDSSDLTAIVFAETRNKAKSIAQHIVFEDYRKRLLSS